MREMCDALLCIPVLLLWFVPLILALLCAAKGGCACLSRFFKLFPGKREVR
jgi:hypothetical protein